MAKDIYKVELEGSLFEIEAQKAAIKAFLKMEAEDRKTIITFSKLAADHRSRISQVLKNNKALEALKEYWETLLQFA